MKRTHSAILATLCLILTLLGVRGAAAADFPPITDEERALTAVPGSPNAPAVVLFKKGEFLMAGYGLPTGNLASSLHIQVRLKILTEEGKSNGEVAISHSDAQRLHGFQGRTVLPDGRVIPVPADAKFVRKTSRSLKTFTTAVAFPSVQVGAILDGDEATIAPSAPVGPLAQPFVQAVSSRRTGVYFDYPYREEVELRLRWPEGWKVEGMPQEKNLASAVGGLTTTVEVKPAERSLVYTRRLDLTRRALETSQQYEAVRSLFGDVEKSDAQALVLAKR